MLEKVVIYCTLPLWYGRLTSDAVALWRLFTQTKNFPLHHPALLPHHPRPDPLTIKMAKLSGETPMDFEWQARGPGDVTSPFYQLGLQHENKKRKCLTSRGRPAESGHLSIQRD